MSDDETRRLERALSADPNDMIVLEALAASLTRSGLGWAHETLPSDLVCSRRWHGVYVWTRHNLNIEMVRVPPSGHSLAAFYVGRYPVTRGEYEIGQVSEVERRGLRVDEQRDHPAVNITHAEAMALCSWAGLRLPTDDEWTRAAFGDGEDLPCLRCRGTGRSAFDNGDREDCPDCRATGSTPRKFPWGNEAPTPDRCVAGGVLYYSTDPNRRTTLPVRLPDGRPSRPDGASPCGAMDMVGHVWHWTHEAILRGSSFRQMSRDAVVPYDQDEVLNDVGFRCALSHAAC